MGLDDRDYMRERYRAREAQESRKTSPFRQPSTIDFVTGERSPMKGLLFVGFVIAAIAGALSYSSREPGPPQPMPENGTVFLYRPASPGTPQAPFKLVANQQDSSVSYVVKLTDWESGAPALEMFVRGGDAAEAMVPLGAYRVSIAQGTAWYGHHDLFGKRTLVTQGVEPSVFRQDGTNRTTGNTITLTPRMNGNYPIKQTGRSAFTG